MACAVEDAFLAQPHDIFSAVELLLDKLDSSKGGLNSQLFEEELDIDLNGSHPDVGLG